MPETDTTQRRCRCTKCGWTFTVDVPNGLDPKVYGKGTEWFCPHCRQKAQEIIGSIRLADVQWREVYYAASTKTLKRALGPDGQRCIDYSSDHLTFKQVTRLIDDCKSKRAAVRSGLYGHMSRAEKRDWMEDIEAAIAELENAIQ